ncbi:MAG: hypothetical protein WC626_07335 [Methanoregula sp.]
MIAGEVRNVVSTDAPFDRTQSRESDRCNVRPMYDGDLAFLRLFEKGGTITDETDLATAERLAAVGLVRFGTSVEVDIEKKTVNVVQTLKTTQRGKEILEF